MEISTQGGYCAFGLCQTLSPDLPISFADEDSFHDELPLTCAIFDTSSDGFDDALAQKEVGIQQLSDSQTAGADFEQVFGDLVDCQKIAMDLLEPEADTGEACSYRSTNGTREEETSVDTYDHGLKRRRDSGSLSSISSADSFSTVVERSSARSVEKDPNSLEATSRDMPTGISKQISGGQTRVQGSPSAQRCRPVSELAYQPLSIDVSRISIPRSSVSSAPERLDTPSKPPRKKSKNETGQTVPSVDLANNVSVNLQLEAPQPVLSQLQVTNLKSPIRKSLSFQASFASTAAAFDLSNGSLNADFDAVSPSKRTAEQRSKHAASQNHEHEAAQRPLKQPDNHLPADFQSSPKKLPSVPHLDPSFPYLPTPPKAPLDLSLLFPSLAPTLDATHSSMAFLSQDLAVQGPPYVEVTIDDLKEYGRTVSASLALTLREERINRFRRDILGGCLEDGASKEKTEQSELAQREACIGGCCGVQWNSPSFRAETAESEHRTSSEHLLEQAKRPGDGDGELDLKMFWDSVVRRMRRQGLVGQGSNANLVTSGLGRVVDDDYDDERLPVIARCVEEDLYWEYVAGVWPCRCGCHRKPSDEDEVVDSGQQNDANNAEMLEEAELPQEVALVEAVEMENHADDGAGEEETGARGRSRHKRDQRPVKSRDQV